MTPMTINVKDNKDSGNICIAQYIFLKQQEDQCSIIMLFYPDKKPHTFSSIETASNFASQKY